MFEAINKCFVYIVYFRRGCLAAVELLGVTGEADLDPRLRLERSCRSLRTPKERRDGTWEAARTVKCVSSERMGDEALAKKLSNLDDEIFVIIVACPRAGKHDTASKKVAKYGAKSKVRAAWANKLQTRVRF